MFHCIAALHYRNTLLLQNTLHYCNALWIIARYKWWGSFRLSEGHYSRCGGYHGRPWGRSDAATHSWWIATHLLWDVGAWGIIYCYEEGTLCDEGASLAADRWYGHGRCWRWRCRGRHYSCQKFVRGGKIRQKRTSRGENRKCGRVGGDPGKWENNGWAWEKSEKIGYRAANKMSWYRGRKDKSTQQIKLWP